MDQQQHLDHHHQHHSLSANTELFQHNDRNNHHHHPNPPHRTNHHHHRVSQQQRDQPAYIFHPQTMQSDITQRDSSIPSYLPPGIDPATVDFRTFYPYIPNEVKHRKRTSRAQLRVLEDVFRKDTKPNGALRKKLAKQLDMTARGVQVWFQNRRAKEKTQAKKARAAEQAPASNGESDTPSPDDNQAFSSQTAEQDLTSSLAENELSDDSTLEAHNRDDPPPMLQTAFNPTWQASPSVSPTDYGTLFPLPDHSRDAQYLSLRRGSLPVIPQSPGFPVTGPTVSNHPANLHRRRSVDTSLYRLATHPYAHLAAVKNSAIYGSGIARSPSQLRLSAQMQPQHPALSARATSYNANGTNGSFASPHHRPILAHRASLPHALAPYGRGLRLSNAGLSASPSPSPLSSYLARAGSHDARLFAAPTARSIGSPIEGPLPSPDFSFGVASRTPPHANNQSNQNMSECDGESPEMAAVANAGAVFPPTYGFPESDVEDGASSSASYFSRFGSIASLAGSESSNTSALFSEVGSVGYDVEARRGSCASGHMLEMMHGLDMNANSVAAAYSPDSNMGAPTMHDGGNGNHHHNGANDYPSPSSTASPGQTRAPSLPLSTSSELVYALQNQDRDAMNAPAVESPEDSGSSPETSSSNGMTYFYPSVQQDPPQPAPMPELQSVGFTPADKYAYESDLAAAAAAAYSAATSNGAQYQHQHQAVPPYPDSTMDLAALSAEFTHCSPTSTEEMYAAALCMDNVAHSNEGFVPYAR